MQGQEKNKIGVVLKKSGDKTVTVLVERFVLHARVKKYIRRRKRFAVHDEKNECGVGDKVAIVETRPISKRKSWKLGSIIERGIVVDKNVDDAIESEKESN